MDEDDKCNPECVANNVNLRGAGSRCILREVETSWATPMFPMLTSSFAVVSRLSFSEPLSIGRVVVDAFAR